MPSVNQLMNPMYQTINQGGNAWTGYKPQMMTTSPYSEDQRNRANQAGNLGWQGLQTGQMPGGVSFDPIAQQAQTQFNTQTIPSIAERFSSLGGGQRSSAFQGALGQAGAGLQENLAAMKSQYMMQMMPMLMQMFSMGQQPQFEQQVLPGREGVLSQMGGQFAHGFGAALPGLMTGNPLGGLFSGLQGLFSKGAPNTQNAGQPQYFGGGITSSYGLPSTYVQNKAAFDWQ
jgi:hypothetical protein